MGCFLGAPAAQAGTLSTSDFPGGGAGNRVLVAKLSSDGASLAWTRFVGPIDWLAATDVAVAGDRVYVAGTTEYEWMATTPGAYDRECIPENFPGPCVNAFVARGRRRAPPMQ